MRVAAKISGKRDHGRHSVADGLPRHQKVLEISPRALVHLRNCFTCEHSTSSSMSMITATTWVPRGFAAPFPTKYDFNEEEYDRISKLAKLQLDDAKEDLEEAQEEKRKSNGNTGGAKLEDTEYVGQSKLVIPG